MIAANMYSVFEAAVVMGGLIGLALTIGTIIWAALREEEGRPLLPWGARMRVERAQANLELDAIEVKRLAIESQRNYVIEKIRDGGTPDEIIRLALQPGDKEGARRSRDRSSHDMA